MKTVTSFFTLLRPLHWSKNLFVLCGFFFAERRGDPSLAFSAVLAFAAFCLMSSAGYALNDFFDRHKDRLHPRKKNRPFAAGLLPSWLGPSAAALLGVAALLLGYRLSALLALLLLLYLLLNLGYSSVLKRQPILDVFCIAAGFVLRVLAGTTAIGIPPSHWLLLCTLMLSLFLALGKRYAELIDPAYPLADKRPVLEHYSREYLRLLLGVTLSATLITYALYTVSPRTVDVHGSHRLAYTLPVVLFACFRYLMRVMQGGFGENTVRDAMKDAQLVTAGLIYVLLLGIWLR